MKHFFILTISFFLVIPFISQDKKPLIIGDIVQLHSKQLNEDRRLNINLPLNYDSTKAYPVLYVLDGSMNEDFLHIAGLVQFFNLMYQSPELIVVGISNVDRKRDFTFHTELKDLTEKYPTTGHSKDFIAFLEKELQPFIQSSYSTTDEKMLIGQSLGGLLATEILLKHPKLFSHYFIISPSLWWDNESMLKDAKNLLQNDQLKNKYVSISVGKGEHKIMRKEAKGIYKVLQQSEISNSHLHFQLMKDENHATILHNAIYRAFTVLWPTPLE